MATFDELDETVDAARSAGCNGLVLLKCTSTYPSTPDDSNILTIPEMRNFETFLADTQSRVTGTVYVQLSPYQFQVTGIKSENDLMSSVFGSYGEMNKAWTVTGCGAICAKPCR